MVTQIQDTAMIRTDRDTLARLKVLAKGKPVSRYLRELAAGSEKLPDPVFIVARLEAIERSLENIENVLETRLMDIARESTPEQQDLQIVAYLHTAAAQRGLSVEEVSKILFSDEKTRLQVLALDKKIGNRWMR